MKVKWIINPDGRDDFGWIMYRFLPPRGRSTSAQCELELLIFIILISLLF